MNFKQQWAVTLSCVLLITLSACGGGGDSGSSSGGSGSSASSSSSNSSSSSAGSTTDTDGDGISDVAETSTYGTNPNVKDTDGDGFLDGEEIQNWDRFSGNHLRFNPLVADVPRIYLRELGTPVIQLLATTQESGSISKGMSNSNSADVTVTTSRGRTNTHKIEEQHTVDVNANVKKRGPITVGTVSASYEYQNNDTTTDTSYWNETTVQANRQASSEFYEAVNSQTVLTEGGQIKVLMGIANDGDVSYTLNNMELAAYMEDPENPGNLISVGTLTHTGSLSFTPNPLGPKQSIQDSELTPFNFTYTANGNPQEISRILENSNQLVLKPANLSLTGQRSDVDLNLAAQNIRARTAEVIIDFGDHNGLATERYRVAVDTGTGDNLPFDRLMQDDLNIAYQFAAFSFNGGANHSGLTSVRNIAANAATNSYWLVAHTYTPVGSPAGTTKTDLYNILSQDFAATNLMLRKGDVLHMVYITDTDLDGLSDRLEQLNGTQLDNADSDGDGLDDALESYGWFTNLAAAPCDQGANLVFVRANPLVADSDGDGSGDAAEYDGCTNPMGELSVTADNNSVASISTGVTLHANPANYSSAGALHYSWTQLAGTSVGQLPSSPVITFTAPAEVTTLVFRVDVTDTAQNNITASDTVRIVVAKSAANAWFVDPDTGHDFNNSGTPDSPLRTLEQALQLAQSQGGDIYLNTPDNAGVYQLADTIVVPANSSLFGGFDINWQRDAVNKPAPLMVAQPVALAQTGSSAVTWLSGLSVQAAAPVGGSEASMAILLIDDNRVIVDRVKARGSDLEIDPAVVSTGSNSFVAASSYGVLARNLQYLDIRSSDITSGLGSAGAPGVKGDNGATGAKGGNGSGIDGGGGGNGNGNGAAGGGGADATAGVVGCASGSGGGKGGDSGGVTGGGGGSGASASLPFPYVTCYVTVATGGSSVSTRAPTGAAGTIAALVNSFDANGMLIANNGGSGGKGTGGAGGGGGGSGAGVDLNNGGGGGGGGEGGDGGLGGSGGRGAGGSFGLALVNVQYTSIVDSMIATTGGGTGGLGGAGGTGGNGGGGGTGADSDSRKGGNGGSGGPGGNGGRGGGGSGGPTAGLVLLAGSSADVSGTTVSTGSAGNGSAPNAGTGGWNYGVYKDGASMLLTNTGNSFALGTAGNGAPAAANISP